MSEQFSCTITIGDKPDWNLLGPKIIDNFLSPVALMVKRHHVGSITYKFLNREDCRLLVEYYLEGGGSGPNDNPVYAGHIQDDTRVAVLELFKGRPYPEERISLKEFLVKLSEFFVKIFQERTIQYAEVSAIDTVIQETMTRLRSIKATAHFE